MATRGLRILAIITIMLFATACNSSSAKQTSQTSDTSVGNIGGNANGTGVQPGTLSSAAASRWHIEIDDHGSGFGVLYPVAGNGLVLYSAPNPDGEFTLNAIDARTGALRWHAQPAGGVAINKDTVFVGAGNITLHALDIKTGTEKWSVVVGDQPCDIQCAGRMIFWPVVAGDTVYGSIGGRVVAVDAATGHTRWKAELKGSGSADSISTDGNFVLVSMVHALVALTPDTGKQVWSLPLDGVSNPGTAAVDNGMVYLCNQHGAIIAVDEKTGTTKWSTQSDCSTSDPVVTQGALLVINWESNYAISKVDLRTGKAEGSPLSEGTTPSCGMVVGGDVLYLCEGPKLVGLDLKSGGKPVIQLQVDNDCAGNGCYELRSRPYIVDGMAFVMLSEPSDDPRSFKLYGIGAAKQ